MTDFPPQIRATARAHFNAKFPANIGLLPQGPSTKGRGSTMETWFRSGCHPRTPEPFPPPAFGRGMKPRTLRFGTLCRLLCFGFLVGMAPLAPIVARADTTDADSQRQQAVSQYIDGATKELDVYRQQISVAGRPENQQLLGQAKAKLAECDKLLNELKSADPGQFDLLKSSYERTRAEMVKALQAAQKT